MLVRGHVVWHQVVVDPILVQNTRITNQAEQESPIFSTIFDVSSVIFRRFPSYFWRFFSFFDILGIFAYQDLDLNVPSLGQELD